MTRLLVIPVCLVLALAGCGGDDEEEPASTPAAPAETQSSGGGGGGGGGGDSVTIKDFAFDPQDIKVSSGTEIEWTNEDSADHNVIFDGDTPKDIDNLEQGQSGTVTSDKAGSFSYVCTYHPGMEGTVEVQ
jgi:plastocyanin